MSDVSAPEGAFTTRDPLNPSPASTGDVTPAPASKPVRGPSIFVLLVMSIVVSGLVALVVSFGAQFLMGRQDNHFTQQGKVMVGLQGEREVFYAVPFQAPPNLQIEAPDGINWNFVKLKEQKADRFVVQYSWGMGSPIEVRWRAEGVRGGHHP